MISPELAKEKMKPLFTRGFFVAKNMNTEAFIHGIYPHSEGLIAANQGLDKGRVSAREHFRIKTFETFNLVALQKNAEFVFTENGQFEWQDAFRPLIDSTSGLNEGPLKRWFDTDTFYRQPVISEVPEFDEARFDKYISQFYGIDQKVTFPSPFTFAKLSYDKFSRSFDSSLGLTTEFLGSVVQYLASKGIKAIQLNEPYLPYSERQAVI
jgi:5-methyltetrahydropteroyltriglutamate--homocysteine methyltransferase